MKLTRPVVGKIIEHGEGLGVPSPRSVERRAWELALIEGRTEVNESDWQQAFAELHGGHPQEADESALFAFSERDGMGVTLGNQTARLMPEGEESLGVELVAEGMDEAAHDSMLAARHEVDLPESRM